MARVSGLADKVVTKTTKTGKPWYSILVNGQLYSLWEKPKFNQGDMIEFDEIIKGDFKNMGNPVVSEGGVPGASQLRQTSGIQTNRPNGSFDPDRESRIVRQNATSSAVALVNASKLSGKTDVDSLLAVVKETAKKIFEMNMYGYDSEVISVPQPENAPRQSQAQDVDALLRKF